MSYFLSWTPERVKRDIQKKLLANGDAVGTFVAGRASQLAPKRTGALAAAIEYVVTRSGWDVEIVVGVPKASKAFWAKFQELGTRKMAAHPFLRPAVEQNAAEIVRLLTGGG